MKRTFVLSLVAAAALSLTGCKQSAETQSEGMTDTANSGEAIAMTTANFGVRGNCGMCKTTIETAASEVDGVDSATWDREMKSMEVSFDASKTNLDAIHAAIAKSGYDTEMATADETAYQALPECCQYDRAMAMNQASESDPEHDH